MEDEIRKIFEETVDEIIGKKFDWHLIQNETPVIDIGIDSMNFIKVVLAIEKRFHFEFADEDLNRETFGTFGNLISYIKNNAHN